MSDSGDYVLDRARKLVQHCEHCQSVLRTVLEWADRGLYDPVDDLNAMRLPGDVVRSIRELLEPDQDESTGP